LRAAEMSKEIWSGELLEMKEEESFREMGRN